jgi:hypothetical protein
MHIVTKYGSMWARNEKNIRKVPGSKEDGQGVYVLFDGSMPVYVGKGNIRQRIRGHRTSARKGQLWDRFSWYVLADKKMMHDIEVLMLSILPTYLRALTKQGGHFRKAMPTAQESKIAEYITRNL